ncbi:glycosyltransferase family 4 protein [Nocardioides sp. JQ2195]|uniref:glycosyltransferase family 4 protein n=1 Tax=Nocardioides sp. JQ2195 TaxID=2592334 RepID=UPI00143E67F0|nr:glycosyltransferase family 4 protein [Nocardioides sp. JQ2195]QIX26414.1 glycosyltransferase family 4 protein [Nocardioides sp. JQ2195]
MQHTTTEHRLDGRHVVFLSWRDTANPEGGGAELYLEEIAQGLVERGARVTIFSAAHDQAPPDEMRAGIRYVRRGSKLSVYLRGMLGVALRRFGHVDVVVDVQNGLPFFSRLVTRRTVVVLVHHVHREQWPVVYPGLFGKVGWWIERVLAPRLYRHSQYVAVSQATREELIELGVDGQRIAVVHNGTSPPPVVDAQRSASPTMCVVGRLVPHKQVEHAIDAWAILRDEVPGLRLVIVGDGWWADDLRAHAATVHDGNEIAFEGHVTEIRKHEIYASSWVLALPSLKEGWGLVVGEAGSHGTPCVAYSSAGGTRESIVDGVSGLLVDDEDDFVSALRRVLADSGIREALAEGARDVSRRFTWEHAHGSFAQVLTRAMAGEHMNKQDPDEVV